jgi:hypothetical protein
MDASTERLRHGQRGIEAFLISFFRTLTPPQPDGNAAFGPILISDTERRRNAPVSELAVLEQMTEERRRQSM